MPFMDGLILAGILIVCIFCINLLVLGKFSFARLRAEHIEEMDALSEKKKVQLSKLYKKPGIFINTAQFLIIFLTLVLAYTGSFLVHALASTHPFIWIHTWEPWVIDFVILLVVSLLVLIFGEIIPKALGLSFPLRYIVLSTTCIIGIHKLVAPFIWLANGIGNWLLRSTGAPYRTEVDLVHSEEEIRMMVNRSHSEGVLTHVEGELIDNVFDFVERMAKEVMIPRQDVKCLYVEDSYDESMKTVRATSHTRYPLCVEDKDHIIGLVHIKDLMEEEDKARKSLRLIRRNILTVPEVMKLSVLLQYMRSRRIYQAIVVDEYGGMVGLVCLEDIVEELVGDIQDEHESPSLPIITYPNGTFEFDGKVLIDDVEDAMHINMEDADEDTIGGYIFGLLERTPLVGDTVDTHGYQFEVMEVQGYRISRLRAKPLPKEEANESNGE